MKIMVWSIEVPDYKKRLELMSLRVWYYRVKTMHGWDFHPDLFLGLSLVPME
jgi:hypothetical protein